jgi:hypothetical protein
MRTKTKAALASLAMTLTIAAAARGDVFMLANDGLIQGELVNKNETPREKYIIQTVQGGQVTLDRQQVVEVRRESAAQAEYEKIRGQYADTVEGQWKLAEWCREHVLLPSREVHLKRILELDPNHEPARRGLGYVRKAGHWMTQEEIMTGRGYVRYKGDWMLPEEVELLEAGRRTELSEKQWAQDLKRWREWLNSSKADEALANIAKISDPYAVGPIRDQLARERRFEVRKLWIEALGRINTLYAWQTLIDLSVADPQEELRLLAVDELVRIKSPEMVNLYLRVLQSKPANSKDIENYLRRINRAAYGLASLGDTTAIGPLIDVLALEFKVTEKVGSEAIGATFPTGGGGGASPGGLSMGTSTRTNYKRFANESVRGALVKLSGVNFGFETDKWKTWHAARRQEQSINLRRDE